MSLTSRIATWESRLRTRRELLDTARKDHAKADDALAVARKRNVHPRQHLVDAVIAEEKRHELRLKQVREAKTSLATLKAALVKKLATPPMRIRALNEAAKLVGVMEHGGNNRGEMVERIIRANGGTPGEAWCGDFVAWSYRQAGSKAVTRSWAGVRFLGFVTGQSRVSEPLPGDIVCYSFDHTGLFVRWENKAAGTFIAVEGNTGRTGAVSDSATGGDGVYRKVRNRNLVSRWVRVTR